MTGMSDVAERFRSEVLQSLDVVGTAPEERFDRVVRLAQQIFRVPIVAVSFFDGDRHWVKAHVGLDGPDITHGEAFCRYTIREPGTMVVRDAAADERFATNSFVTGSAHVRFYAGHPVRGAGGHRVGVLYLIDDAPRDLSREQTAILSELAGWIESELALREELARAEGVQHGLLPHEPPSIPGFGVAGCCIPASEVGGDFFDWFPVGDEFQFTIADVMGKGLGAALIAASVRAVLRTTLRAPARRGDVERRRPLLIADAVTSAARGMEPDLQETSSFVTLFTARLEVASGTLRYVDAGHGLSAVVGVDGVPQLLSSDDVPIGVLPDDSFSEHVVELKPGDTLICVSDGVLDFFSSALEVLDAAAILARGADTAQQVIDEITRFARARHIKDDITAIVVRRDTAA
jgi:serine phosphatase RsbU (regulator of sigma subunit)